MLLNLLFLLVFGLCWGLTVPLTKITVSAGHHPLGMIFWQMLFSALLLGVGLLYTRQRIVISKRMLLYYLLIACLGTLVPNGFSLLALQHLPAGIIALVIATVPLVSLVVAVLARIETFSWLRFMGVILGVSALMLIMLPDTSLPDPAMAPWLLVAMIAPVCYALEGNLVAARAPVNISPVATLFGASCIGVLLLAPIVWPAGIGISLLTHWDVSRWTLLGSAVGHVIAYSGYLWLLGRAGAVFTSQLGYVVTLTGMLGAVILLNESYGLTVWIALAMMLAGVTLVRPMRVERVDEAAPSL